MKQHPGGSNARRILFISFVVALTNSCATLSPTIPPAKPITDFKDIAGKWEGKIFSTTGSWSSPIVVIINEDGTGESIVPPTSLLFSVGERGHFSVKRELVEGRIRSKSPTSGETGILTLHEGGGRRVLLYISDDGKTRGEYEPAKK